MKLFKVDKKLIIADSVKSAVKKFYKKTLKDWEADPIIDFLKSKVHGYEWIDNKDDRIIFRFDSAENMYDNLDGTEIWEYRYQDVADSDGPAYVEFLKSDIEKLIKSLAEVEGPVNDEIKIKDISWKNFYYSKNDPNAKDNPFENNESLRLKTARMHAKKEESEPYEAIAKEITKAKESIKSAKEKQNIESTPENSVFYEVQFVTNKDYKNGEAFAGTKFEDLDEAKSVFNKLVKERIALGNPQYTEEDGKTPKTIDIVLVAKSNVNGIKKIQPILLWEQQDPTIREFGKAVPKPEKPEEEEEVLSKEESEKQLAARAEARRLRAEERAASKEKETNEAWGIKHE